MSSDVSDIGVRLANMRTVRHSGRVVRAVGTSLSVTGLPVRIGERCVIFGKDNNVALHADVVGIDGDAAILVPLSELGGVSVDARVEIAPGAASLSVGTHLLGRVLDGFGNPMDGAPTASAEGSVVSSLHAAPPNPLQRRRIDAAFPTGVRAIDGLCTVGVGQRVGIFAPAGVGKSTLMGMLAGGSKADVIVVALIGERGREVREFIEDTLGAAALSRSVVVVATSDRSAMERIGAARTATAVAEGFREQGASVLLLMDSVTRYARALREVGLSAGEAPVRQGFPPSVFAELPRLFERAGNAARGSITAFYTVLTEDEETLDPIAEETRSILDGHLILSRSIAENGRYPAIDVAASLSRLFPKLAASPQQAAATRVRTLISKFSDIEFLLQVDEYTAGSDALADEAIRIKPLLDGWLAQTSEESPSLDDTVSSLLTLLGGASS